MKRNKIVILHKIGPPVFNNWDEKIKGEDTLTKEDMKQISDLMDEKFVAFEGRMDEKFIASEDRMRAEMDAVPKRFDAVETNLGRKISESEAATRRYTEKLFFQVAEGKKKRSVRSSGLEG